MVPRFQHKWLGGACPSTFSPPPRRSHEGSLAGSARRTVRFSDYNFNVRALRTVANYDSDFYLRRFSLQCYTLASISSFRVIPSFDLYRYKTNPLSFHETAFLYYDHIVTFPEEVRKIWKRRLSFLNILFIIKPLYNMLRVYSDPLFSRFIQLRTRM